MGDASPGREFFGASTSECRYMDAVETVIPWGSGKGKWRIILCAAKPNYATLHFRQWNEYWLAIECHFWR